VKLQVSSTMTSFYSARQNMSIGSLIQNAIMTVDLQSTAGRQKQENCMTCI